MGTAGGTNLPVRGDGQMKKLPSVYVPDANASMISVQQFCEQRDAVALFLKDGAVGIKLNNKILKYLSKIREIAKLQGLELLNSHVNNENLYEIHTPNSNHNNNRVLYQGHYTGEPQISGYATFYHSAEFQEIQDVVRFFHEAWAHPSKDLMCWIVNNSIFQNIPAVLTAKAIRKHFPHCEACPAANMAQQPKPGLSTNIRDLFPGEEIQIDIKVIADNSKRLKHKRAIGGYTCALTVVDMKTGFKWVYLLKNQAHLEVTLEAIRLEIVAQRRELKVIRLDNQFVTEAVNTWKQPHHITILPCIPHEHWSIGEVERFNRTLEMDM